MGFARLAESPVRKLSGKSDAEKLSAMERIACSSIGGALATWNQPIEVVRVEMQSMAKGAVVREKPTIMNTLSYVYKENGIKGLYRGVTPRICLGIWQTVSVLARCLEDRSSHADNFHFRSAWSRSLTTSRNSSQLSRSRRKCSRPLMSGQAERPIEKHVKESHANENS